VTAGPTYRRAPHVVWRASGYFLVAAVPPAPPTRIVGSASLVWAQLAEPVTIDALVTRLGGQVAVPAPQVRADVDALIAQLVPLGLIEVGS
jgi:hypothetical protein